MAVHLTRLKEALDANRLKDRGRMFREMYDLIDLLIMVTDDVEVTIEGALVGVYASAHNFNEIWRDEVYEDDEDADEGEDA